MVYDLTSWGLQDRFVALAGEYPDQTVGRVTAQEKGLYRVVYSGAACSAAASGKLRHEALTTLDLPAVGDFVMLDASGDGGQAVIRRVLARKSVFVRRAAGTANAEQIVAANVDTVFICMSLNNDFNLRRLERYLSVCWDSGATPVVLLTKADLCDDLAGKRCAAESVATGADILTVSALDGDGYAAILPYLKSGVTVAFVGSSGVGKSTLINRLLGGEVLATNGLRNDDKGRHTTTHRELIMLPNGCMVMDTPGMRELGMWDAESGVERGFADIEALAARCRFSNCTHAGEPGCAVRAAVECGELNDARIQSWIKLKTEAQFARSSESYLAAKREKFKQISKINKSKRK